MLHFSECEFVEEGVNEPSFLSFHISLEGVLIASFTYAYGVYIWTNIVVSEHLIEEIRL
jgi:hypothetical protein